MNLDELIKNAMKSQNKALLLGYRSVKAKVLLEKTKEKPSGMSEAEMIQQAIRKEIKERLEANTFFKDSNHPDLKDNLLIVESLKQHLPQALGEMEQQALVKKVIAEVGAKLPADMKKVMQALAAHKDQLDLKKVSGWVTQWLKV